jgi:hypothetical protein
MINQETQKQINDMLIELAKIDHPNFASGRFILQHDAEQFTFAVRIANRKEPKVVCFSDEGFTPYGELFLQAALREAIEARGSSVVIESWLAADMYWHNIKIREGSRKYESEGPSLTLALGQTYLEVLSRSKRRRMTNE